MIGQRLSHYRILEVLGTGGMGVVYRARDERLERDVALKVLAPDVLAEPSARQRFRKEALSLSRLSHPNIGMLFDFDSQGGVDFIVMELVEGETLGARLARGPLPEVEVARLGEQLAEGLAAAHAHAVIHRDIKPANIRITPEGRVKLLDFGLAQAVGGRAEGMATTTMTAEGMVVGTVPYMSPEQLRGERVDARSDLFSLGSVLYEMATGQRPFPQQSQPQVITAILGETPQAPRRLRAGLTSELERIVLKCLEKERTERYQTAADLATDLRRLARPRAPAVHRPAPWAVGRRRVAGVAAAGLVVTVAILVALDVGGVRGRLFRQAAVTAMPSLAVLPLVNLSGDPSQEYFADGMTDELITRLAQVSGLRVISRSSVMQYKGTRKPVRGIARELGVKMVVEGTVVRGGDAVRISAQLVEAATDRNLWAESYERSLSNVLGIQSEVARAIVEKVRVQLTPEERGRLANAPAVNPDAHEAYLRGLAAFHKFTSDDYKRAIEYFTRATETDPSYAPAWSALATVYQYASGMLFSAAEANTRARAAATKAIQLDPGIASAYAALAYVAMIYDWDPAAAERGFKRALELGASDVDVHASYGAFLTAMGRTEEAVAEMRRVREIDPLSQLGAAMSLWPLFEGHRFAEAAARAQEILAADPNNQNARMVHGEALLFGGDRPGGVAELRRAAALDPGNNMPLAWLGYGCGVAGRQSDARAVLAQLQEMSRKGYVQPYLFALVYAGLGNKEEALRWLEKAVEERSDELVFVRVDPALDSLRPDPRFKSLLARMGIKA